jgi:CHAT domain-containing protein/tetratricopeptide (TPR) repeat protein
MTRASLVLLALLSIAGIAGPAASARASDAADWAALNDEIKQLSGQGAYRRAIEVGTRALALAERAFGGEDGRTATSLNNLGLAYSSLGQYREAKPYLARAVAIRGKLPEDRESIASLHNLGLVCFNLRQLAEALEHLRGARAIATRVLGEAADETLLTASGEAAVLQALNRQGEAEALLVELLALAERHLAPNSYRTGELHFLLGSLLNGQARYGEAETHLRAALGIIEVTIGLDHPSAANLLQALGLLHTNTGRPRQALAFYDRARRIVEQNAGPGSPLTAATYHNMAHVLWKIGERRRSLEYYGKALAGFRSGLGPDHPYVATVLSDLSVAYEQSGRLDDALEVIEQALTIREKGLGADHPDTGIAHHNHAHVLERKGRIEEASAAYRKAIRIFEANYGERHPHLAMPLGSLADLQLHKLGLAEEALRNYRRATAILIARTQREAGAKRATIEIEKHGHIFRGALDAAWAVSEGGTRPQPLEEAYLLSQWLQRTAAALALAQTGARLGAGDPALGRIIRQRQDLVARWRVVDRQFVAAMGGPRGMNVEAIDSARTAIADIEATLARLDQEIGEKFPGYASLTNAEPLTLQATRQLLRPGEALLQLALSRTHVNIWVITDTQMRWVRSDLSEAALAGEVAALRCGLDATLWQTFAGRSACLAALGGAQPQPEKIDGRVVDVLPFDVARAHALYMRLLGPVEDLIAGRHLLVVPSGALASLPLHVLVTAAPQGRFPGTLAEYRRVAWLAARQPVTVLPSVVSLRSLRSLVRPSRAAKPYFAIGNPLLDGPQDDVRWGAHWAKLAADARGRQQCPPPGADEPPARTAARPVAGFDQLLRGGRADIEEVRRWAPLPETADELCAVGRRLGVAESEILLGARATEGALKTLSDKGLLQDYRILHFATHGALTGQVGGAAEPGLILTPPAKGTVDGGALDRDDGFLTASEIAGLRLDADWVILSACNTAGGGAGEHSEALSGMARAFFYAGARSLLVSHWEVESHAAVRLTTRALAQVRADPSLGRAEALRRSMLDLMRNGAAWDAHPAQWAPFVVVGEGAR